MCGGNAGRMVNTLFVAPCSTLPNVRSFDMRPKTARQGRGLIPLVSRVAAQSHTACFRTNLFGRCCCRIQCVAPAPRASEASGAQARVPRVLSKARGTDTSGAFVNVPGQVVAPEGRVTDDASLRQECEPGAFPDRRVCEAARETAVLETQPFHPYLWLKGCGGEMICGGLFLHIPQAYLLSTLLFLTLSIVTHVHAHIEQLSRSLNRLADPRYRVID